MYPEPAGVHLVQDAASNPLSRSAIGSSEVVQSLSCGLGCSLDFRASPNAATAAGSAPQSAFSSCAASAGFSATSVEPDSRNASQVKMVAMHSWRADFLRTSLS